MRTQENDGPCLHNLCELTSAILICPDLKGEILNLWSQTAVDTNNILMLSFSA